MASPEGSEPHGESRRKRAIQVKAAAPLDLLARLVVGRPRLIGLVAALATGLALLGIRGLPVDTSLFSLLPKGHEEVERFERAVADVGGSTNLLLLLEGAPRERLIACADELARCADRVRRGRASGGWRAGRTART